MVRSRLAICCLICGTSPCTYWEVLRSWSRSTSKPPPTPVMVLNLLQPWVRSVAEAEHAADRGRGQDQEADNGRGGSGQAVAEVGGELEEPEHGHHQRYQGEIDRQLQSAQVGPPARRLRVGPAQAQGQPRPGQGH